jgi:lipopolysaccharide/colanic/teichoic acid biosynthesis glycosyltransferase/dTDP-glucose pyrophosphorylase
MKAVILSNDYGMPIIQSESNYPKATLPILNRPSLEYLIDFLRENHVKDIFLITNSDIEIFLSLFGYGEKYGVTIHYIKELHPEGTAGCLRIVEKELKTEPYFLLVQGGIVMDFDLNNLIQFHKNQDAVITVAAVRKNATIWPLEGMCISNGNHLESFYRAHHSHDRRQYLYPCGLYLIDSRIFSFMGKDKYLDLKEQLIPKLKEAKLPVVVKEINGHHYYVSTVEDYYYVQWRMLNDGLNNNGARKFIQIAEDIWTGVDTEVSNHSTLVGPALIGKKCKIRDGAIIIGPTVIGDNCQISEKVLIRESIIWNDCVLNVGSKVQGCIITDRVSVKEDTFQKNSILINRGLGTASVLPLVKENIKLYEFNNGYTPKRPKGYEIAKLIFDFLFSSLVLLFGLPVFIFLTLLIKLESKGPIFFRQIRCGKNGKEFKMLKFRSMISNADTLQKRLKILNEVDGPVFKISRDPRLTRVGRLLRKFSLDEFPQFINVIKGDMSVVGPRPLSKEEIKFNPVWRDIRLTVKPGITGQWQVSGRSEATFKDWIRHDTYYVNHRSFLVEGFDLFMEFLHII